MRILVIDDDPAIRNALRMALRYEGYEVTCGNTGTEGLTLVEHERPDLVLLDVDLPGMDGLDVLRTLHATDASIQVVMMSGCDSAAIMTGAMQAGAVDYLVKPFESTDCLYRTIRRVIEHRPLMESDE